MTTTLIISTYNRPDALSVCLDSVKKLRTLPTEVIVGDDGSRSDTEALVRSFQSDFPVPLRYIRQEDEGFRLAMIRNKCIALAKGEYIIQIDGDIFLHRDFISDHLREARPGYFLKGGRVQLNSELTDAICLAGKSRDIGFFSNGIDKKRANTLHLPLIGDWLAPRYRKNRDNVLGCNMSFYRRDLLEVNGYDESFEGWGGEDLDLSFRLRNAGIGRRYLKFCGLAYHLWHNEASKTASEYNHSKAYYHNSSKAIKAERGLDKYL
ncbi:MAG: glycosyltransferase family 2 protein [Muribaculaceae bacterium]|nr:glycosyltransferase family 2 protein [Muribaculaceae bacterium]